MRILLIALLVASLPSPSSAQEEGPAWTASINRAEESCGATAKLDLDRWKDFAEALSSSHPRHVIAH